LLAVVLVEFLVVVVVPAGIYMFLIIQLVQME
jgi:hypothetical protein